MKEEEARNAMALRGMQAVRCIVRNYIDLCRHYLDTYSHTWPQHILITHEETAITKGDEEGGTY